MKLPEEIILRPHVTERSNFDAAAGKYTFVVDKRATKPEIRSAIEQLFNVKVITVNTANCVGKEKRQGAHSGFRPDWKKAVVKIDVEGKQDTYLEKGGKVITNNKKYKTAIEEFGINN
ncbi:MAG: 50S ribosomal protein L23 [Bacillota bacterium]